MAGRPKTKDAAARPAAASRGFPEQKPVLSEAGADGDRGDNDAGDQTILQSRHGTAIKLQLKPGFHILDHGKLPQMHCPHAIVRYLSDQTRARTKPPHPELLSAFIGPV